MDTEQAVIVKGQTMKDTWDVLKSIVYQESDPVMLVGPFNEGSVITCVLKQMHTSSNGQRLPDELRTGTVRVVPDADGVRIVFRLDSFPDYDLFWQVVDGLVLKMRQQGFTVRGWRARSGQVDALPVAGTMSAEGEPLFNQRGQTVDTQINVAGDYIDQRTPPGGLGKRETKDTGQSRSLERVLNVQMDHGGEPHKAGPGQWWVRLRIECRESVNGCWGQIYDIQQLSGPNDRQGKPLCGLHVSRLSWARNMGLFAPMSIQPGVAEYLDLAWRAHGDPLIPATQLRVASALDVGERNTQSPKWGMRQDFIPLEPGYYLFVVRIIAEGYSPLERTYQLHWPGPGREDDVRLTEIPEEPALADESVRRQHEAHARALGRTTAGLDPAIVRIYSAGGRVAGAGFLAGERRVLTCAHVVDDALGRPRGTTEMPQAEVRLDFPLVAAGKQLAARVTAWRPQADVAGLELSEPPLAGAAPAVLVSAGDLWGHSFRAFGFPQGYENGVWASGRILGREATGWVQVEDLKQTGYFVQPGFSGAPVWDETLAGVVGMIVAAEMRPGVRAAFLIPADALAEAWPGLNVAQRERRDAPPGIPTLPAPSPPVDVSALRARLQRLDAVEIESLCLDHFPAVYDKFGRGLRRDEMLNLLLDHCRRDSTESARLATLLK